MNENKCPKCNGEMKKGLMMAPGAVQGVRWLKGEPNKLFNFINKLPKIAAFSCEQCGYMENFVEK
jgi:predicted nucleic acid-binding Zn ribbon protein